jgi:cell division protein YceG involved in septum cleavage
MGVITEIIIWSSPIVAAGFLWLFLDAYKEIKDDVKDLKTSNSNIRTDVAKLAVQQKNTDDKVMTVGKAVERVQTMVHEIDKQQIGKRELEVTMNAVKQIESRMNDSDTKYGQILLILDGMAKRIGIQFKKSGS